MNALMTAGSTAGSGFISPFKNSKAYSMYLRRPRGELSVLFYLLDCLKTSDVKVLFKGTEYNPVQLNALVRCYVMANYKKEKAEDWIRARAYKSARGNIYFLKYPDGSKKVLRDVLLEELARLKQAKKTI